MFGLQLRCDFSLPELPPAAPGVVPDVAIASGKLPAGLPTEPDTIAVGASVLLNIEGVARYWISGGQEILIERTAGVAEANVRLYLLGSAMGLLLLQRGCLPLHANAIEIGAGAAVFMGRSGAGKSTLAAWFHDRGHRVFADDVSVIRFGDDGAPIVMAGIPRLRLWKEALLASGRAPEGFSLSYAGDRDYEKYDVAIGGEGPLAESAPLGALYLLERGTQFEIAEVKGAEKADALFANTYRGGFIRSVGDLRSHWSSCLALIARTPLFRISRPWNLDRLTNDVERIQAHFESLDHGEATDKPERAE